MMWKRDSEDEKGQMGEMKAWEARGERPVVIGRDSVWPSDHLFFRPNV